SAIEPKVRTLAENAAVHAGLRLPGHIMEELVAVAPWALAMARRLKRDHPREAETASIFDPGRHIDWGVYHHFGNDASSPGTLRASRPVDSYRMPRAKLAYGRWLR